MTNKEIALKYFPEALEAIGELSRRANEKHNPGEPIHWAREKSNDHWGSWGRHLSKLGAVDPESDLPHDVSWAWRTLAILQIKLEQHED